MANWLSLQTSDAPHQILPKVIGLACNPYGYRVLKSLKVSQGLHSSAG
jgi:hypothetical protein